MGGPQAPNAMPQQGQNQQLQPTQQTPQAPLVPPKQNKVTPVAKPAGLDPVVILQVKRFNSYIV